jgi:hypothetical protein
MSTFVDLAWDTDSVQTVLRAERPLSSEKVQPTAQGTSNPHNVRKSLKKTGKRRPDLSVTGASPFLSRIPGG